MKYLKKIHSLGFGVSEKLAKIMQENRVLMVASEFG